MSTTIDVAFVKQYEREVWEAFQRRNSVLLNTVRRKPNVVGTTTTFQKIGKGTATTKSRHGLVTPMDVTHTTATATMTDFYAGDYVDKLDEMKVNIDERRALASAGAAALGRKVDNQIITALDGTTSEVAHASTSLTLAKIQSAFQTLGDNDVFENGRMYFITGFNGWNDLMNIDQFANSRYVSTEDLPFIGGHEARVWMGTTFIVTSAVNDATSGSTYKSYWYHEDAVGYGWNQGITADIWWSGERAAHFVNHMMSGGGVLIDSTGVVEVQHQ